MKLLIDQSTPFYLYLIPFLNLTNIVTADRKYLGLLPFNRCGAITQPQKGYWVQRGEIKESIITSKLTFSEECEQSGETNGKCMIHCAGFTSNLIMDRQREGTWDRSIGDSENSRQTQFLAKCKCETFMEDDGRITTENCEWKAKRYWREEQYREDFELGDAGIGEEPWIQPTKYPLDAEGADPMLLRKKRSLQQPRMKFYCEDEAPEHIFEDLNLKPHDMGINESVRQTGRDNKGFESCGNMNEIFPTNNGEWRCKLNMIDPISGLETEIKVDPENVPHEATCSWGCNANINGVETFESKEARFSCQKPWIGRPDGRYANKEAWRRFRGYGLRIYKQGMLDCQHYDTLRR